MTSVEGSGFRSSSVETNGCATSVGAGAAALTGAVGVAAIAASVGDAGVGVAGWAAALGAAAGCLAKGIAAGGALTGCWSTKYESNKPEKKLLHHLPMPMQKVQRLDVTFFLLLCDP